MREIIGLFLSVFLIFSAIGTASASNISFEGRTPVSHGWGSTEYEPYITLTGNNNYIVVAGGPNYDYEVRINLYNKVWEIVSTGDIPNEGIQFTLYFQYKPHGGYTQIYSTLVTVTGEGVAPILEGVNGHGSSSINTVRVTDYTILGDIETDNKPGGDLGMDPGTGGGSDTDDESGAGSDVGTGGGSDTDGGSGTGTGGGSDTDDGSGAGSDVGTGGGSDTDGGSGTGTGGGSDTDGESGAGSDVGTGGGSDTNGGSGTGTGDGSGISDGDSGTGGGSDTDGGSGAGVGSGINDGPSTNDNDSGYVGGYVVDEEDEEDYAKHLDRHPNTSRNDADDSNESNVLDSKNNENDVTEEKIVVAGMEETGLPFAIIAILTVIGLFVIKIRR